MSLTKKKQKESEGALITKRKWLGTLWDTPLSRLIHLIDFLNQRLNGFTDQCRYISLKKCIWFCLLNRLSVSGEKRDVMYKATGSERISFNTFDWTLACMSGWKGSGFEEIKAQKWCKVQKNTENKQSEMLKNSPVNCRDPVTWGKVEWWRSLSRLDDHFIFKTFIYQTIKLDLWTWTLFSLQWAENR